MKHTYLIVLLMLLVSSCSQSNFCTLEGVVVDRPNSKTLLLAPFNTDYRVVAPIEIPINEDGTFAYSFELEHSELYSLVFKDEYQRGAWTNNYFITERGAVNFVLYSKDSPNESDIRGGKLNRRFNYLQGELVQSCVDKGNEAVSQMQELGDEAYSVEYNEWKIMINQDGLSREVRDSLFKVRNQLESQDMIYSQKGKEIIDLMGQINDAKHQSIMDEIRNRVDEAGLAMLYKYTNLNKRALDIDKMSLYKEILHTAYAKKYSQNPMYIQIEKDIRSSEVVVGANFVEFAAPDLHGVTHNLSDLIKGKVVVLDLWASWCAPCIRTSKSFIPIWKKYKDKGFDIVGVARENENTNAMERAIERIGMKWINLVELNDRAEIWNKYNAGNSGGKVILIDRNGVIVAMDFDANELESHLQKLLE